MRRALIVLALLLTASLAGCAVPSGVNEDAYGHRVNGSGRGIAIEPDPEWEAFASVIATSALPRPPIPGEDAYDRYLENATSWGRDGLDDLDRERELNASSPDAARSLDALDALRNTSRGSEKEVHAHEHVRALLVLRHGVHEMDANTTAIAERLHAAAERDVRAANASIHEARASVPVAGVHAFMRAEAVLGLALSHLQAADAAGDSHRARAVSAVDARVAAAGVNFWLQESARAGEDAGVIAFTDEARARQFERDAAGILAGAEAARERMRNATHLARAAAGEIAAGMAFVRVMQAAGLPEGAWAAAQGLRENILVFELARAGVPPDAEDVTTAWEEAAGNVRSYRDAQRYDQALAFAERASDGGEAFPDRLAALRAFAAVALMASISEDRETALAPS